MEDYEDFTVSAFPKEYKKALSYLGPAWTGWQQVGCDQPSAIASQKVKSPSF
jgi:hypothetical protein